MSKRKRDDEELKGAIVTSLTMSEIERALEEYEEQKKARLSVTELDPINIIQDDKKKKEEEIIIFELNRHLEEVITDHGKRKKLDEYHAEKKDVFFAEQAKSMVKKTEKFPPILIEYTRFGDKEGNHMTMGETRNGILYFDENSNFTGVVFVERWKDEKSKILDPNQKDFIFYKNGEVIDFIPAAQGVSRLGQDFPKRLREKEQQLAAIKTTDSHPAKEALKGTASAPTEIKTTLKIDIPTDIKIDESKNSAEALKIAISEIGSEKAGIGKISNDIKKLAVSKADNTVKIVSIKKGNEQNPNNKTEQDNTLEALRNAGDRLKRATDKLKGLNTPKNAAIYEQGAVAKQATKDIDKHAQAQSTILGKNNSDKDAAAKKNAEAGLDAAVKLVGNALGALKEAVNKHEDKPQAKARGPMINLDGKNKKRELFEAAKELTQAVTDMKDQLDKKIKNQNSGKLPSKKPDNGINR